MPKAQVRERAEVSKDALLAVIRDYESYPSFVEGVHKTTVIRVSDREAHVTYDVDLGKRIEYACVHEETKDGVAWTLLRASSVLKKNSGRWMIEEVEPNACQVTHEVEIELSGFVPAFIFAPLLERSLPKLVASMIAEAGRRSSQHK